MSNKTVFPQLSREERLGKLAIPEGKKTAMVLDTDTYNEIDDQFAVAYAVRSPERIDLRAVTAAPFFNDRSSGPADGMEKSYNEILHLLKLLGHPAENFAFRGAAGYLPDADTPVDTPAARRIIELAGEYAAKGETLYVCGIGAITNIASALLLKPEIIRHIVVVWLGGHPQYVKGNSEFNLRQDVPAVQCVLNSGVPFIRIPAAGVSELLMTSLPQLKEGLASGGELGKFLFDRCAEYLKGNDGAIKVIWDIAIPGLFAEPGAYSSEIVPTPILNDDLSWSNAPGRPEMRVVRHISRGWIFHSLFRALGK